MSDSTPASPSPSHPQQPARNMADIARMFLDGARPVGENDAPRRTGPKERVAEGPAMHSVSPAAEPLNVVKPMQFQVTAPAGAGVPDGPAVKPVESKAESRAATLPLPRATLALLDPEISASVALSRMSAAAARVSQDHGACVGLLMIDGANFTIDVIGATAETTLPVTAPAAGGLPELQVAPALFTLRHVVQHWLIASPTADHPDFPGLAAGIEDWLLITPTGNEHVVAAYQELKRALAISDPGRDPRAILLAGDPDNALVIHARLRRAAAQFLKKDLELVGIAGLTGPEPLRVATVAAGGSDGGGHGAVYAAVLDELCGVAGEEAEETLEVEEAPARAGASPFDESSHSIDIDGPLDAATAAAVDLALQADHSAAASSVLFDHLTHVLDPEERDALNAEPARAAVAEALEEAAPEAPSTGFGLTSSLLAKHAGAAVSRGAETLQRGAKVEQAKACTPCGGGGVGALRAVDLASHTRSAQWDAVESSVSALVDDSVLLEAKPPMSWASESCLALDKHGALHVWTLYKDSGSWFALKEWAGEHKSLLALTRRDLAVRQDAPITVHIVLPLEGEAEVGPLMRNPSAHVRLYRMRAVEWKGERGVVVVPLA